MYVVRLVKVWTGMVVYGCSELLSHGFCDILRMIMISNGCLVIIIINLFRPGRLTVIRVRLRYTDDIIIAVFRNHINYIILSNHIPPASPPLTKTTCTLSHCRYRLPLNQHANSSRP